MMGDLVEFINELVDDQIQMRTCIPLTPELKDFYGKLIGRQIDEDSSDDPTDDVDDDGRYEKFLTPKKRFTRKAVSDNINLRTLTLSMLTITSSDDKFQA